jgi:hypothetical protein
MLVKSLGGCVFVVYRINGQDRPTSHSTYPFVLVLYYTWS